MIAYQFFPVWNRADDAEFSTGASVIGVKRMRNWMLGTSIVTALLLGAQLAGAQGQGQAGGATSQAQGAEQNRSSQGSRPAQEAGSNRSGADARSAQQE